MNKATTKATDYSSLIPACSGAGDVLGCFGRTPPALGKGSLARRLPSTSSSPVACIPRRTRDLTLLLYHHLHPLSLETTLALTHPHLATPAPLSLFHQQAAHSLFTCHPALLGISPAFRARWSSPPIRIPYSPFATHTPISSTSPTYLDARSSTSLATSQASQRPWATTTAHTAASFAA